MSRRAMRWSGLAAVAAILLIGVAAGPALARTRTLVSTSGSDVLIGGPYTLVVHRDRSATLNAGSVRHTVTLARSIMRTLDGQLKAVRFSRLHHAYRHIVHRSSGIGVTTVTYARHTVIVDAGARAPRALLEVVETLRAIALKLY